MNISHKAHRTEVRSRELSYSDVKIQEVGHGRLLVIDPHDLHPSPENDTLYRRISPKDKAVQELATSIRMNGVIEPLVITADCYIVSGHRRHVAAIEASVATVPVRYLDKRRAEYTTGQFVAMLREHNRHRVKSVAETIRETVIDVDPEEAYAELLSHRKPEEPENLTAVNMSGCIRRKRISVAKSDMVAAVRKVLEEHKHYLPISDRKIHYELAQHYRPLRHTSKPDSKYLADNKSYKNLVDLLTRMRTEGIIPHWWISDETRPQTTWRVFPNACEFIRQEVNTFGEGYRRDLMQSQEVHIEICVEKNTALNIIKEVARKYAIPVVSLRGMSSLPPKYQIAERFKRSGKSRLVLLLATDFDPSGESIAENMSKGLRDEFGIEDIKAYKIAVTPSQAKELGTAQSVEGISLKRGDTKAEKFRQRHGKNVVAYELEALSIADLQRLTHEAIDTVLNIDLLNADREAEKADAAEIATTRKRLLLAMGEGA